MQSAMISCPSHPVPVPFQSSPDDDDDDDDEAYATYPPFLASPTDLSNHTSR
jgi:hypothetical protein